MAPAFTRQGPLVRSQYDPPKNQWRGRCNAAWSPALRCVDPRLVSRVFEGSSLHAHYVDGSSVHGRGGDHNGELAQQRPVGIRASEVDFRMDELDGALMQAIDRRQRAGQANRETAYLLRSPLTEVSADDEQQLFVESACLDSRAPMIDAQVAHGRRT